MESSAHNAATSMKRFVVEDSITKVTSDGEPHEMMTMIAGLSGLLAAIAILAVLISLVACKKNNSNSHDPTECKRCSNESIDKIACGKRPSLATIYTRADSVPEAAPPTDRVMRLISISTISSNASDVVLQPVLLAAQNDGSAAKRKQKQAHWSDNIEQSREITIDVQRL